MHAPCLSVTESDFLREFSIDFLTRSGCHLCESARPLVEQAARRARAAVREVDIDESDELTALYGLRIPVIRAPDGTVLDEGIIDDVGSLRKQIERARRSATRGG